MTLRYFCSVKNQKIENFPFATLFLVLSCCIISLPLLVFQLHDVFGGEPTYPWEIITYHFGHGNPYYPSDRIYTFFHFIGNVSIFLFCGMLVERCLGTLRFVLLTASAAMTTSIYLFIWNSFGLGASGITWSYTPFTAYFLLNQYQKNKVQSFKKPVFLLAIFFIVLTWLLVPLYFSPLFGTSSIINVGNVSHSIVTVTGFVFLLLWRSSFRENLGRLEKGERIIKDSISLKFPRVPRIAISGIVAIFFINVIVMTGVLTGFIGIGPGPRVLNISPAEKTISALNSNEMQIQILFDRRITTVYYRVLSPEPENVKVLFNTTNSYHDTVTLQITRDLKSNEEIQIKIVYILDYSRNPYRNLPILLSYM
ncbi:MAG: rhomboid family intramembrane serine protease [Candidatus Odinarchaeota archaeon]